MNESMGITEMLLGGGFLVFGLALAGFWIWMLIDCLTKESSTGNDKVIWTLVILFGSWIGALVYFFVRRKPRLARVGA